MKTIEITKNENLLQTQKDFTTELKSYLTENVNVIFTNGNLAAVLMDSLGYTLENFMEPLEKDEDGKAKPYKLGKFENIQIMADPYMRWDDNL